MEASRKRALLTKIDKRTMNKAMTDAAAMCIERTHYEVSVEHVFLKLLDNPRSDVAKIFSTCELDAVQVTAALEKRLAQLTTGNRSNPTISDLLMEALEKAYTLGSMHFGALSIRSGHLLLALLEDARWGLVNEMPVLAQLDTDALLKDFAVITEGSDEAPKFQRKPGDNRESPGEDAPVPEVLDAFTEDLTAKARSGAIDPVFGRDEEIYQAVDILTRRRKNNPILVGEPGVGKSAIVEGLADLVAAGKVPDVLRNVQIRTLDLGLLKAGASMKGEFEERLRAVIEAVQGSPVPIILFIDEAHTLIGAGGAAGSGDAANLLKPALARGELRTIAATTWSEYKKYIEKDPALERRFQVVKIDEPDAQRATLMLRGIKHKYEEHHGVVILDTAVQAAAVLADRYITGRQLPDKAIDLLDTACARVKLSIESPPFEIVQIQARKDALTREIEARRQEEALSGETSEERVEAEQALNDCERELAALATRFEKERAQVKTILDLDQQIADCPADETRENLHTLRRDAQAKFGELAGESPLLTYRVTADTVSRVVSQWTGIPVGKMGDVELDQILELEQHLKKRVLGQDHVADRIAAAIRASKAAVNNPETPIGVFLAVGPSGTGKTEMALTLADFLFGGERFITQINMSEYQEKHTVSRLIGSPPGYVGYGEGGVLSEAVRQRPYSVVLLDEVEKGHPDVMNLFYQVFDKGFMADGEGRLIDFKNTVLIMTSNIGSRTIEDMCAAEEKPSTEDLLEAIREPLNEHFKPALLARMTVLPYFPISEAVMKRITALKLHKIVSRLKNNHRIDMRIKPDVLQHISDRCRLVEAGARNIDKILNGQLLPLIADHLLRQLRDEEHFKTLTVDIVDDRFELAFE